MPGLAYSAFTNSHYRSDVRVPPMQDIVAEQWTALICHERPKSSEGTAALRVAFVTKTEAGAYEALDAESFINRCSVGRGSSGNQDLFSKWNNALTKMKQAMTSLKKAPETEPSMPQQVAGAGSGLKDIAGPHVVKVVAVDTCDVEEVTEAVSAIEVLKDKPFNQNDGMPAGAVCQQN